MTAKNSQNAEKNFLEIVAEKIQDKSWTEQQDPKFIEAVNVLVEDMESAARQNVMMVSLFNEYAMMLHSILNPTQANEADSGTPSNTNFSDAPASAAPANREQRRAASKRKTPLDIVSKK